MITELLELDLVIFVLFLTLLLFLAVFLEGLVLKFVFFVEPGFFLVVIRLCLLFDRMGLRERGGPVKLFVDLG